ncbi:hypothetical protein SteCoe_20762 [Stentor coeruleus]|uniref:ENTH domain-containing protein n=1 Tax=Stentor coeruleus TaxID=5963 RepID=A0A1R2BR79_9CILI|nr:hypothetical protein SteCoe_20762 [Stentor coeruleus]
MERIKKAASELKQKFTKSDLEKSVHSVIKSSEQPLKTAYYSIADRTISLDDCRSISKIIWEYLAPGENDSNRIFRALQLVEALVRYGSLSFVADLRSSSMKFRSFLDYFPEGKSLEQCSMVREISRKLLNLLSNQNLLDSEREDAKRQRERTMGFSSQSYADSWHGEKNEGFSNQSNIPYPPSGSWYDQQKIPVAEDFQYNPPQLFEPKKDIFSFDPSKSVPKDIKPQTVVPTQIRTLENPTKTSSSIPDLFAPETKTIHPNLIPAQPLKEPIPKKSELFGLPLKNSALSKNQPEKPKDFFSNIPSSTQVSEAFPIFSNIPNTQDPIPIVSNSPINQVKSSEGGKLFGIPLKQTTKAPTLQGKSEINTNTMNFDFLTLNMTPEVTKNKPDPFLSIENKPETMRNPILPIETVKREQKIENNNMFGNLNMKASQNKPANSFPIIVNTQKDLLDFDAAFPVIKQNAPVKEPVSVVPVQKLEAKLMNIDDLFNSLSSSVAPRKIDDIKL